MLKEYCLGTWPLKLYIVPLGFLTTFNYHVGLLVKISTVPAFKWSVTPKLGLLASPSSVRSRFQSDKSGYTVKRNGFCLSWNSKSEPLFLGFCTFTGNSTTVYGFRARRNFSFFSFKVLVNLFFQVAGCEHIVIVVGFNPLI